MKKLILIRHAKAEQLVSGAKDFDRTLTTKGIHAALKVGISLSEKGVKIDQLVASSSCRTQMTAEYLVERIELNADQIVYREELYLASLKIWLQEINQLDDDKDCIVMVGHNPEISYLAEYLTGENLGSVPTCGTLAIDLEVDTWKAVSQNMGGLSWKIYPKEDLA